MASAGCDISGIFIMTALSINTGAPKADGRYVAFIRCQAAQVRDFVEPIIMVWHGGKWQSTFMPRANVVAWCGPIPVMKISDIAASATEVYDL